MKSDNPTPPAAPQSLSPISNPVFGNDLSPSRFKDCLVLLCVLGLIIRAWFLIEHARSPSFGVVTLDQKYYDAVARMLLAGEDLHLLHGLRPLLYPMFLAFLYKIGGLHGIDLAVIVQHFMGIGTGVVVALLGARLFRSGIAGIIGGALFLLAPVPLGFEGELLIEPSYTFLICLALLLHLRAADAAGMRSGLLWIICGALVALAAQARANILVFLAVYPLLAGWQFWRAHGSAALLPMLGLVSALAMAVPWGIFNTRQTDHFHLIPNAGGVNLFLGNNRASDGMVPAQGRRVTYGERYEDSVEVWARQEYNAAMLAQGRKPDPDPMAISKYWSARAIAEIEAAPVSWLKLIVKKCWLTFWNAEIPNNKSFAFQQREFASLRLLPVRWIVLLVLAPAGIWAAAQSGNRQSLFILMVYVTFYLAANVAFFICDRYRYPVVPVMSAIAGGGLLAFYRAILRADRAALGMALGMVLMAALSLPNWFGATLPSFARDYFFRSIAWYEKGRFPEALADIDESIKLDPSDASALHQRGNILLAMNRFEDARADFEQTLKISPEDAAVWNNLGIALEGLGQTNNAVAAYQRAIQSQPPSRNAFLSLIFIDIRAGNLADAGAKLDSIDNQAGQPDAVTIAIRGVLAGMRRDSRRSGDLLNQARTMDTGSAAWAVERATGGTNTYRAD